MSDRNQIDVAVIGGGAAGLMAAISAAKLGARVTLFEKNDRCGKKLSITGKGRCNVTNDCNVEEFLSNVPANPRFLYGALSRFDTADTKSFFENAGVPLKVERGRRVFPVSDKAVDIVKALMRSAAESGVEMRFEKVLSIGAENGKISKIITSRNEYGVGCAIICTGGKSYPATGSDGDGYTFAKALGHTVTSLLPSLVPMTSQSKICPSLQGLSLKNVSLDVVRRSDNKEIYSDFGEMMFTHFGLTGPMILSASAHIPDVRPGIYEVHINLKPALDEKTLDTRILSDFSKYANKDFINALSDLLPQKLIPVIISLSGIDEHKKVNSITKDERHTLVGVIRCLKIPISGFRPINEAIVTRGGISTKEINPKTMESKICERLYFAGEVMDVDAYTGGFNLQIAFSTGVLAGESAAMAALSAKG